MLVCDVTMRGFIQICLTVSGLCVVMRVVVGGGFIVVCRCGSVCDQIPTRGDNITQSSAPDDGYMVARNMLSN